MLQQKIAKKKEFVQEAKELKEEYDEYVSRYGLSYCPHVPREHGEDTSLMVEIVEKNHQSNLFNTVQSPDSAVKGSPI